MHSLSAFFSSLFRRGPALKVAIHHVLRADSVLTGTLEFEGGLSVEGQVNGHLHAKGPHTGIVVGNHAKVTTEHLKADTVLVHGWVVAKTIEAKKVVLTATAQVEGDIDAESFEVHTGAQFKGQVIMRGAPSAKPVVADRAAGSASTARNRLQVITDPSPKSTMAEPA